MNSQPVEAFFRSCYPTIANPHTSAQSPTMNAALTAEISRLSPAEKLLLVEELWNEIAAASNTVEPPAWHDQVLAEDAADYTANPARGDSWANVKRRIAAQA